MTVAIINQKGGTGKTTTTINLGAALSERGKSVLLLDLDPQGNLSYALGVTDYALSLTDCFEGKATLEEILMVSEELSIAPGDIGLADIEISLVDADNREYFLRDLLQAHQAYDYVLIDCPPSLSLLTVNALSCSQLMIIPMQMEVLSLQGLDLVTETIDKVQHSFNPSLEVAGILPVMVDKRRKLSTEIHEYIQENFEFRVFDSKIRPNVKASEAPSFGQSVIKYAPNSNSATDYRNFASEFLNLFELN